VRAQAIVLAGLGALALAPAAAHAGPDADELKARGERLAKNGRYSEAIEAFKAADRLEPRASHACLIALAYTRRELWPQAEIYMERCHGRATASDPEPEWVPQAEALIEERLRQVDVAPVEISTEPALPGVKLSISSFAPDETFGPRTIHLPSGHHTVIARAEGYEVERRELDVTGRALRRVVIKMWKVGERPRAPSELGRYLVYGGLGVGVAGAAAHVLWYRGNLDRLRQARDEYDLRTYRSVEPAYDVSRWTTVGLYAIGGAAVIAGGILHLRSGGRRAEAAVTLLPRPEGGGVVAVEWAR
jgi:tetratricopeptide (TPR) repeat protein